MTQQPTFSVLLERAMAAIEAAYNANDGASDDEMIARAVLAAVGHTEDVVVRSPVRPKGGDRGPRR